MPDLKEREEQATTIYVFSLLVGYFPNGVDYAQGYRAGILRKMPCPVRYVFTELPEKKDVEFYKGLGIREEEMLSVHHFFLDHSVLKRTVKVQEKLEELKRNLGIKDVDVRGTEIRLMKDGTVAVSLIRNSEDGQYLSAIHYFHQCKLIRTEVYTDQVAYVDYYVTAKSEHGLYAKRTRRIFCHRDGSPAYEQIFKGDKSWYLFPDGRVLTKSEFFEEFAKRLYLSDQDIILIDRFAQFDHIQPLFRWKGEAKTFAVMHAGHYFEKGESAYTVNLNPDYNYLFKYSGMIHKIVVSTRQQKEDLAEKLSEYHCKLPDIIVIPAGGVDRLQRPDGGRKPYSMLSVSRIQAHKKINWMIESVIKAHQVNENISLDIYGSGSSDYMETLQNMVKEQKAQSYIHFMGHQDVTEVYKNYEVFLTASTFETLGLSILEAVSSGNAVIGLDAKYGSRLLIRPGINGCLLAVDLEHVDTEEDCLIDDLAEKVLDIFENQKLLEKFQKNSYKVAGEFFNQIIEKKWEEALS